ncbi:MAG: glycoside hydrolase family 2 protein, partial [Bacteroidia bacterium]
MRQVIDINQVWSFAKESDQNWQKVNLPHTWNAFDVMDDEPGYYRGIGKYKKRLVLKPEWKTKQLYLKFEAANQETEVYLNGVKIGGHKGGYTAFIIPLANLKFNGTDQLEVKVNNQYNESIAPLTGDFTFFGGIYRTVSLVVVDKLHFSDRDYASTGVFVQAKNVSTQQAEVLVNGNLSNSSNADRSLKIISVLSDHNGKKIGESNLSLIVDGGKEISFTLPELHVSKPSLWSPAQPYLYKLSTRIVDGISGKIIDELQSVVGLRFFSFDVDKGFFLNGEPFKLIGASRHQDFAGMGNAVPTHLQVKDVHLLKEMGGNFLRVAHYPQDQAVLEACDRLGILASVEIPIVNEITESDAFTANAKQMQLEMIKQNFNHPSVIIWAYMNEVLLKMRHNNDPDRKLKYLANIANLA